MFNLIRSKTIHYCTPYNQYKDLEMAILKESFKKRYPDYKLIITGPNRVPIETL